MRGGGLRLAVTLLTVVPLPRPRHPSRPDPGGVGPGGVRPDGPHPDGPHPDGPHPDGPHPDGPHPDGPGLAAPTRREAGAAMGWAPVIGLALGGVAAGVLWVAARWAGPLLGAVLAIAALAALTGGLHLDGLADLADGLGSRRPAAAALEIMKQSDIGPFGVVALVLTLLIQVAALDRAEALGRGSVAVVAAAVTARLAMTAACRPGVPAARRSGLGALVAGSVRPAVLAGLAGAAVGGAALFGTIFAVAVLAGLAAGLALTAAAVRRLGGITGDVLGAAAEIAAAACLLVTALR